MYKDEVMNEFQRRIEQVRNKCVGFESFGDTQEFYDEDGVVLMTAEVDRNSTTFRFGMNEAVYTMANLVPA